MTRFLPFVFLLVFFACRKQDSLPEPVIVIDPPAKTCALQQVVVNPSQPAASDTLFLEQGRLVAARGSSGTSQYTYQYVNPYLNLWKRARYNAAGKPVGTSLYDHNLGAGQLLGEFIRNPADTAVVDSTTDLSYLPYDAYLDRINEVNHYAGRRTLRRRFIIDWDWSLKKIIGISVRDSANYPVASYTFTYNEAISNPFKAVSLPSAYLFVTDPSGYPEAVKLGLFFSFLQVTKVTASIPGSTPLNLTYGYDAEGHPAEVLVNGVPMWTFRFRCE